MKTSKIQNGRRGLERVIAFGFHYMTTANRTLVPKVRRMRRRYEEAPWSAPCGHYFMPYAVLHMVVLMPYGVLHMAEFEGHMECFIML